MDEAAAIAAEGVRLVRDRDGVLAPRHRTDLGNAERLVARHGGDLRYCRRLRTWLVWDGTRWAEDTTGEVTRRGKDTVRAIYDELREVDDPDERKALARHAASSEAEPRIRRMVSLAESEAEVAVDARSLDVDPWALNVANGTIDLRTGKLREHRREDLITKLVPVAFDPAATSGLWEEELVGALPDPALRAFVQKAAGYSITGDVREDVLFFPFGPTATRKTTVLEAVKAVLGDYSATADFSTFLSARSSAGGPRSDIARLAGARMVVSVEVEEGRRLAEGLVKLLTGGDTVTARGLYREETEFRPQFKLWLVANHRPRVRDDDDAIWRRIRQIPFDEQIPEAERDPAVKAALRDLDEHGPAILAWLIEGCASWVREGLAPPDAVVRSTRAYREEMDPLKGFLEERCVIDPDARVTSSALYDEYTAWAKEAGVRNLLTKDQLSKRLIEKGFEQTKVGHASARGLRGIGLVTPTLEEA